MEEADSANAIEVAEQDYQDTLKQLSGAKAQVFEPFRIEYEKLYKALNKSHELEKRLRKKMRELNQEISQNAQSVQTAMKTVAEDQENIARLRKDIDTQTKLMDQAKHREKLTKEKIAAIKEKNAELAELMEQGTEMSYEQEAQLLDLKSRKEQFDKDRDMTKQNADMVQEHCSIRHQQVLNAEKDLAAALDKITENKHAMEEKRREVEAEKERKELLEQKMKDLRHESEVRLTELTNVQAKIQHEKTELEKLQEEIETAREEEEGMRKQLQLKRDEKEKLDEKLQVEVSKNEKYEQENHQREMSLRERRQEIQQNSGERDKIVKMHEALKTKDRKADEARKDLEAQRNELKTEHKSAQQGLEGLKRDGDVDRKKIEDLLRERDILNKNVIKADERTKKQIDLVKRQETQVTNMQKDIVRWKGDVAEFRKRIKELEKQREKYGVELSQANAKFFTAKEELRSRSMCLTKLEKEIATAEAKRTKQKNLYDAEMINRNMYAKQLSEQNEQIAEMKRKFRIMFHQTTALKEELREKDKRLVNGKYANKKLDDINKKLKDSKEKAERRMKNLLNIVETQRTQMKKLERTIQEAEQERQAQQKELEGVVGERDILGAQLIRRNEELALLYEKIKIQQSTLQKGGVQYQERAVQVSKLRAEIARVKEQVAAARNQVTNVDSLKAEIHYLRKTLLREEAKEKALHEELDNPMNVHRWRRLEGSEPQTYEMIHKVKGLQKLLIAKTEEVVEKERLIQEKEKLYVQLKNIIQRQPGPEVAEQLAWYSQNLKEKTQHMKKMAEELEMYHNQVQDLQEEKDRHERDFSQTKQEYFAQLRLAMQASQAQQ